MVLIPRNRTSKSGGGALLKYAPPPPAVIAIFRFILTFSAPESIHDNRIGQEGHSHSLGLIQQ